MHTARTGGVLGGFFSMSHSSVTGFGSTFRRRVSAVLAPRVLTLLLGHFIQRVLGCSLLRLADARRNFRRGRACLLFCISGITVIS